MARSVPGIKVTVLLGGDDGEQVDFLLLPLGDLDSSALESLQSLLEDGDGVWADCCLRLIPNETPPPVPPDAVYSGLLGPYEYTKISLHCLSWLQGIDISPFPLFSSSPIWLPSWWWLPSAHDVPPSMKIFTPSIVSRVPSTGPLSMDFIMPCCPSWALRVPPTFRDNASSHDHHLDAQLDLKLGSGSDLD